MPEKISDPIDFQLLQSLLQNLLLTNATIVNDPAALVMFEENCCFHPSLTPLLTYDYLMHISSTLEDLVMYEVNDQLDVSVYLFRYEGHTILIGPYVRSVFDEKKAHSLLISQHFPASFLVSLKLYHTKMPLLNSHQIQHVFLGCIHALSKTYPDFTLKKLHGNEIEPVGTRAEQAEVDYDSIYKRYQQESRFLSMIEHGNVAGVSQAFWDMCNTSRSSYNLSPVAYQSPLTVIRILARKAAERSGLSVVKIDEITQRCVQKMSADLGFPAQMKIINEMLLELTEAVHDHLNHTSGYSPRVLKLVEYLSLNYSQNLSIDALSSLTNYSTSQLSKVFKAETGKTIGEYIAWLRCTHACDLLVTTEQPISDISNYVGYLDNNYFVKVFKKQYAVTPSEYRKKNRRKSHQ